MITLALAGKPNCGKSTLYRAATMAPAEIANYPFTTIDANRGVAYVRVSCPCTTLAHRCDVCVDGIRYVPVHLIDVAGLVPEAYTGKGLGNQFLDHLSRADAIINVIDASGATDIEGAPDEIGSHDPLEEIPMLETEMTMWLYGIIEKHWAKMQRQIQVKSFDMCAALADLLAGLSIDEQHVIDAERESGIIFKSAQPEDLQKFARILLKYSKPMIQAGNKADQAPDNLITKVKSAGISLTSGAAELALRSAAEHKIIGYHPGDTTFTIPEGVTLNKAQQDGLTKIKLFMDTYGGTGVQQMINRAVFELLDQIVVYPG